MRTITKQYLLQATNGSFFTYQGSPISGLNIPTMTIPSVYLIIAGENNRKVAVHNLYIQGLPKFHIKIALHNAMADLMIMKYLNKHKFYTVQNLTNNLATQLALDVDIPNFGDIIRKRFYNNVQSFALFLDKYDDWSTCKIVPVGSLELRGYPLNSSRERNMFHSNSQIGNSATMIEEHIKLAEKAIAELRKLDETVENVLSEIEITPTSNSVEECWKKLQAKYNL